MLYKNTKCYAGNDMSYEIYSKIDDIMARNRPHIPSLIFFSPMIIKYYIYDAAFL